MNDSDIKGWVQLRCCSCSSVVLWLNASVYIVKAAHDFWIHPNRSCMRRNQDMRGSRPAAVSNPQGSSIEKRRSHRKDWPQMVQYPGILIPGHRDYTWHSSPRSCCSKMPHC